MIFVNSILAGMMIAIGGAVYLSVENRVIGAFLFGIGLFMVVAYGFYLYTGKVGYCFQHQISYLRELAVILAGNFVGTLGAALLFRLTRINGMALKAAELCQVKLNDSLCSIFILAIFCGILMYLGVEGYQRIQDSLGKCLAIFLAVMVFILSGFEHCVANMFYFSLAGIWSLKASVYLGVMILGNGVGGLLVPAAQLVMGRPVAYGNRKKKAA